MLTDVQVPPLAPHIRRTSASLIDVDCSRAAATLSTSKGGNVELCTYLTQLCESLGASMIADPNRLSISVAVDDTAVETDLSIRA